MSLKRIRRGGELFMVPNPIFPQAAYDISLRNLTLLVKNSTIFLPLQKKFFLLLTEFLTSNVGVLGFKTELHKKVVANRAYLHYRW